MPYRVTDKNGKQVNEGDEVRDFRDEPAKFLRVTRSTEYNGTARVEVEYPDGWKQDLYAQVFGLKVQAISEWVAAQDRDVITDVAVDEIMELANIGADYWTTPSKFAGYVGNHAPPWAKFTVVEQETEQVFHLSRDDIRMAYLILVDPDQKHISPRTHSYFHSSWRDRDANGIQVSDLDTVSGNVIQQIACFGEVRH